MSVASPVTGASPSRRGRLSNIRTRVPKWVPYFLYSSPPTPMLARSVMPSRSICRNQSRYVGESGVIPRPTIATKRPLGESIRPASAMCRAPVSSSFLSPKRPAVCENGGFMTTVVGLTPRLGRMPAICSAFSTCVRSPPNWSRRKSARRGSSSLTWTFAPAFFAWTARSPVPADGSSTSSPGFMFASQLAANA